MDLPVTALCATDSLGENLVQLGNGGCPPLLDITSGPAGQGDWCKETTSNAIREIAAMPSVHTVLLAADWSLYVTGARLNGDYDASWQIRHLPPEEPGKSNANVFNAQLRKTLDFLVNAGKNVVVLKQTPALKNFDPVGCLTKRPITFSQKNITCSISAVDAKKYLREYESILDNILIDYPNVKSLDPFDIFFKFDTFSLDRQCIISKDNIPLFRDRTPHLSYFGSVYVARELMHTLLANGYTPVSPALAK